MTAGTLVGARAGFARATELAWARYLRMGELARRVIVFAGAMGLLLVRRPDSIVNPQFILEDGSAFYAATWFAHNPLELFFRPYAGYQHLAIRLVAALERLVPVASAPLLNNLVGLAMVAALPAYLASDRMQTVIPDPRWRLGLAGLVLLLPGVQESFGTMVDVQRLAALFLLAFFFARPARGRLGTLGDVGLVALAGLSGLTGVILQPLFWWRAYRQRRRIDFVIVAVLAGCTLIQVASLLIDGRRPADLSDPIALAAVFMERLFVEAPLGLQVSRLLGVGDWPLAVGVALAVPVLLGALWAVRRLPGHVRGPVVYVWVAMVVGAFLAQREGMVLANPLAAPRYFIVPAALVLLGAVAWFIRTRPGRERLAAFAMVALLTVGIGGDFRIPSFPDEDWSQASQCLGGPDPCVVPVFASPTWDIHWPGIDGQYDFPRPGA